MFMMINIFSIVVLFKKISGYLKARTYWLAHLGSGSGFEPEPHKPNFKNL